jgi:hypothetical protein
MSPLSGIGPTFTRWRRQGMNTKDWDRLALVTEKLQAMLDDKSLGSMTLFRGDLRVILKALRERGVPQTKK